MTNDKNMLDDWYGNASVRSFVPELLTEEELKNSLPFSPDLVPVSAHPLVKKRKLQKEVLLHHLYHYLDFTINLEHDAINRVLFDLTTSQRFTHLSIGDRLKAHQIMCDESFHALFSAQFAASIDRLCCVSPASYMLGRELRFKRKIRQLKHGFDESSHEHIDFLFAVTSETLITGTLSKAPGDHRVANSVRSLLLHHARDEASHHSYFSRVFEKHWHRFDDGEKEIYQELFSSFVFLFLTPDIGQTRLMLHALQFDSYEIEKVVEDCFSIDFVSDHIVKSSRATMRLHRRNGVDPCWLDLQKELLSSEG